MNVHVTTLANTQLVDQKDTAFAQDVIAGLTQQPKQLSPKYFYDEVGSRLFEQITLLPEYYPTRTELRILRDRGAEIAAAIPPGAALVEFGAGATTKVRLLLNGARSVPTSRWIFPATSSMDRRPPCDATSLISPFIR